MEFGSMWNFRPTYEEHNRQTDNEAKSCGNPTGRKSQQLRQNNGSFRCASTSYLQRLFASSRLVHLVENFSGLLESSLVNIIVKKLPE